MYETTRHFGLTATPAPLVAALTEAALQFGRLAQAIDNHALLPAILFRARLEAARRMAAADGQLIDPWHLAAMLAGLRPRLDAGESIAERGAVFAAAHHALGLHQWLVAPDFDEEGDIQRAEAALAAASQADGPLLAAGLAFHSWIDKNQARQPMRAALARYWQRRGLFPAPLPLIAAASLAAEAPWPVDEWMPVFMRSLAAEAAWLTQLTRELERAWRAARLAVQGRRKTSHAGAAIDLLAAAPLLSAGALAYALDIAPTNAVRLLDQLCQQGAAVEVTKRSKRKLYALRTMEPLRAIVAPPVRPEPGRGRGRPPALAPAEIYDEILPDPVPAGPRLPPVNIDYADLDAAVASMEQTIRRTRATLNKVAGKKE